MNTLAGWKSGVDGTMITYEAATETVKSYPLRDGNVMLVSTWVNRTDRFRPYKWCNPGPESSVTVASTTDIIYASDNLNNFFSVSSTIAYWYTLTTSKTFIISTLVPTDDPNLPLIQSIGLSQNKSVVYHSNGQVDYYKHVSCNLIKNSSRKPSLNYPSLPTPSTTYP